MFKLFLCRPTFRANPVIWQIPKTSAGTYPMISIPDLWVIDIPTNNASVLLHNYSSNPGGHAPHIGLFQIGHHREIRVRRMKFHIDLFVQHRLHFIAEYLSLLLFVWHALRRIFRIICNKDSAFSISHAKPYFLQCLRGREDCYLHSRSYKRESLFYDVKLSARFYEGRRAFDQEPSTRAAESLYLSASKS